MAGAELAAGAADALEAAGAGAGESAALRLLMRMAALAREPVRRRGSFLCILMGLNLNEGHKLPLFVSFDKPI
jgi:hypothetical protein